MTETTSQDPQSEGSSGAGMEAVEQQLAARLVEQARSREISLGARGQLVVAKTLRRTLLGLPGRSTRSAPSGVSGSLPGRRPVS